MTNNNGIEVRRVHKLEGESKVKAFLDIAFAGVFLVKGLKIVEGKNGLFLSMPGGMSKDGKWYNTAYPLTKEFKDVLVEIALEAYETN
ncbi:MAG: SpoVG family protein [Candidatus Omnitrophota bacterium]